MAAKVQWRSACMSRSNVSCYNLLYLSFLMLRKCYRSINVSHIIQTNYYLHTQTSTDESFFLT